MPLTLDFLRRLRPQPVQSPAPAQGKAAAESAFDRRLRKMGGVHPVRVSRAVLFRTRSLPQEA